MILLKKRDLCDEPRATADVHCNCVVYYWNLIPSPVSTWPKFQTWRDGSVQQILKRAKDQQHSKQVGGDSISTA